MHACLIECMVPGRISVETMSLPLCAFAFVFFSTVAHASPHAISWVSEPVLPGETALALVVGSVALANNSVVEVRTATTINSDWQVVEADGFTAAGCAFTLPNTFAAGAFDVRIDGGTPYHANQPRPWFVFADQGRSGTPGGWARVIGEAITLARDDIDLRCRNSSCACTAAALVNR